jgi:hypothetical protein
MKADMTGDLSSDVGGSDLDNADIKFVVFTEKKFVEGK